MSATTQRREALRVANERRMAIARLRNSLGELSYRDGLARVADLLESDDGDVGAMRISHLLSGCYRVGPAKVEELLRHAGGRLGPVSPSRKVRDLTDRQRRDLCGVLRDPGSMWVRRFVEEEA